MVGSRQSGFLKSAIFVFIVKRFFPGIRTDNKIEQILIQPFFLRIKKPMRLIFINLKYCLRKFSSAVFLLLISMGTILSLSP